MLNRDIQWETGIRKPLYMGWVREGVVFQKPRPLEQNNREIMKMESGKEGSA